MFTRSMSHKEVDFVSYVDSKFADLKEKFVKELKEDLLSSITSLINEQNRQIENLNDKLTKQNSTISDYKIMPKFLMNNVQNYGKILTLFKMGGAKKIPPYQFCPCNFYKRMNWPLKLSDF